MLLALLAAATSAFAAPTTLTYQGRLLDAAGGAIVGEHSLTLNLYDGANTGSAGWSETHTLIFDEGYFHVVLGTASVLDADLLATHDYLSLTVDDGGELSRQQVHSVPFAMNATAADSAETAVSAETAI